MTIQANVYDHLVPYLTLGIKKQNYITPEQMERMRVGCRNEKERMLIDFMWHTGAKVAETLEFSTSDIIEGDQYSLVRLKNQKPKGRLSREAKELRNEIRGLELALKKDPNSMTIKKKLKEVRKAYEEAPRDREITYREVPIPASFVDRIKSYRHSHLIDVSKPIIEVSRSGINVIIKRLCEKAGIDKSLATAGAIRNGFAVYAVLRGIPPQVLKEWLGHGHINYTLIYYRVLDGLDSGYFLSKMWS